MMYEPPISTKANELEKFIAVAIDCGYVNNKELFDFALAIVYGSIPSKNIVREEGGK